MILSLIDHEFFVNSKMQMTATNQHIRDLIIKFLQQAIEEQELTELNAWRNAKEENNTLFERLTNADAIGKELTQFYEYDKEKGWLKLKETYTFNEEAEVIPIRKIFPWKKFAVAASIIATLFIAGYWFVSREQSSIVSDPSSVVTTTDVKAPDKNRAQIKLADGTIVYLDSAANGELVTANGVQVIKRNDGQIIYSTLASNDSRLPAASAPLTYNTLSNPRGSKVIDVTLADGSRVWLNAGSSLTYPVAFTGNERNVTITGEAYFEIAHDKTKPFTVSKGEMKVEVLGTHFNVNAYDDEENIKVTLLEGSVKVSSAVSRQSSVLKPGQQAIAAVDGGLRTVDDIDLETVMSWKNGQFSFSNTDLQAVMRQIARWYDVEVVYEGTPPNEEFVGGTSRQENVSAVLKVLEATGKIKFKVEGKIVTVRKESTSK
jgi:transmembrane sensor